MGKYEAGEFDDELAEALHVADYERKDRRAVTQDWPVDDGSDL
jgi:hypothetical protein